MLPRFVSVLLFVTLALGLPSFPLKPSKDDFYTPTWGYENAKLGEILKLRPTPGPIRSLYFQVNVKNSWQLLVRSEDALGNPTAIVTTVLEPHNGNSSRLLSYHVAEDAANIDCSPSYMYQDGGGLGTIPNQFEMFLLQAGLDQGYYVVAPDYESDLSAFGAGKLAGISALNSIRGALQSGLKTNIDKDAEIALWGYSGGSIPSSWAAGLQPSYAPELKGKLVGAAFGGWVTNITATAEKLDGTLFAGFVASAISGLAHQYDTIQDVIDKEVYWYKKNHFDVSNKVCITWAIVSFLFSSFFEGPFRYVEGGWDVLRTPEVAEILDSNILGNDVNKDVKPEIPIFVYEAKLDEIVPYEHAEKVFNAWCGQGMDSFEFTTSISSGHISEAVEGSGAALGWINSMFEHKEPVKGCVQHDRLNTLLHPKTFGGVIDILKAGIKNILGFEIGPNDSDSDIASKFLKNKGIDVDGIKKDNESNDNKVPSLPDGATN